jgi:ribosomal protein L12E/L44/L45/RPP1/RPP2
MTVPAGAIVCPAIRRALRGDASQSESDEEEEEEEEEDDEDDEDEPSAAYLPWRFLTCDIIPVCARGSWE